MDNLNQHQPDDSQLFSHDNIDLIKLLLSERDYHSSHPAEASSKFWYSLGATLTAIVTGLIFKEKIGVLTSMADSSLFYVALLFIFIGHIFLIMALLEHNKAHKLQRERIEEAINFLFENNSRNKLQQFWNLYGKVHFSINKSTDNKILLFAKEPDTREGIRYHDSKMLIGSLFISLGVIIIVVGILLNINAVN